MKRTSLFLFLSIALVSLLSSCKETTFFAASAANNEVLVVMDEILWEDSTGRALFDVLNSHAKGLPQREPNFKILQVTPENFSSTFKMARNIIIPNISNIYSAAKLSAELDKYASGQVILSVNAPDNESFINYMKENQNYIVDYILNKEMERNADWLIKDSGTPQSHIVKVFGFNIHYPKGISNVTEHENFFWATNNAASSRKDIVIYQLPYTSETIFEKDSLITLRNKVLGKYITGSSESRMTTAVQSYNPDYRRVEINGIFRAELRGLWEMTTDMMGGPFVMHAFVNPNTNMVIVVEVFVYAPEKDKRNLMRSMEAALYTIKIPEATSSGSKTK